MWTKKIIIKDKKHFTEIKNALENLKERNDMYLFSYIDPYNGFIVYDDDTNKWYTGRLDELGCYKDVPEYEIITKTSYELKEVKKREIIKIGDNEYYKDELEIALKNIKPI